jgi:hypothetical protein
MICRRWCFGVTVVVVAIGAGGLPAAAQQPPLAVEVPKVEVPGVTVPSITVPVPRGGPAIATPPISTPPIETPAVRTPPIQTPVGTVPSVAVSSVKVAPVTVSPVKTVPPSDAAKPAPAGGGSARPSAAHAPAASTQAQRSAGHAVAVRGAATGVGESSSPTRPASAPDAAESADPGAASHSPAKRRTASTTDPVAVKPRGDRPQAPAVRALDDRDRAATVVPVVPVVEAAERHGADARPLVDALGRALDLTPLLMALALGGALCVVSRQLRRAG